LADPACRFRTVMSTPRTPQYQGNRSVARRVQSHCRREQPV